MEKDGKNFSKSQRTIIIVLLALSITLLNVLIDKLIGFDIINFSKDPINRLHDLKSIVMGILYVVILNKTLD